ncbi:MAG TPA: hypothetical protein VMS37_31405 [Verrucomicrobiae bacterium]|nr:hypothetical protein [Verrucomicrobiae bacterium]
MTKLGRWLVLFAVPALQLPGQTTTTYSLPPSGCAHIDNCIIYGPAESYSLWEEIGANGQSWQIFNVYSWVGGFSVVDTYHCNSAAYQQGPAGAGAPAGSTTQISATCSGVDTYGAAFTMQFTVYAYSYYSRGGGGKGGGGAGTRWWVTGGSVNIAK